MFNLVPNTLFDIKKAWTWFARLLNCEPRRITPLIIHTFLQVAGKALLDNYKKQGEKMIHYILEHVIPHIPKESVASSTQLQLFLEETVIRTGKIPMFEGATLEK